MKLSSKICVYPCLIVLLVVSASAQSTNVKALVGGTLIDGYGSTPIRNSVVIIEGDRIKAVGQVGKLAIPAGAACTSSRSSPIRIVRMRFVAAYNSASTVLSTLDSQPRLSIRRTSSR